MKSLTLLVFLFSTVSSYSQSFIVSSKKYCTTYALHKTYAWKIEQDSLSPYSYYLNDPILKNDIQEAMNEELQNLGFLKNSFNPDVLINFHVLSWPARLHDFEHYKSTDTNKSDYNVDPGTLLVSFIDPNTNQLIWQGFASGLINSQAAKKNTLLVNEAVRLILQEYPYPTSNNSSFD